MSFNIPSGEHMYSYDQLEVTTVGLHGEFGTRQMDPQLQYEGGKNYLSGPMGTIALAVPHETVFTSLVERRTEIYIARGDVSEPRNHYVSDKLRYFVTTVFDGVSGRHTFECVDKLLADETMITARTRLMIARLRKVSSEKLQIGSVSVQALLEKTM